MTKYRCLYLLPHKPKSIFHDWYYKCWKKTQIKVYHTSYSSNSKPSITTTLATWVGGGRSSPWASSHVSFSTIRSSLSILRCLLFEPSMIFFLFLGPASLVPNASFAMYPDLSTFDHELGSSSSACLIDEKASWVRAIF